MKRRIRKIVNFFAFNLLFFALYLNFIHKDENVNYFAQPETAQARPAFGDVTAKAHPQTTPAQTQTASVN
jgi:hypothetical protein